MYTRHLSEIENTPHFVDWGNGTSHRLLTEQDRMGFTICHTVVRAGSESRLHYRNHLEACYCISGSGAIRGLDGTSLKVEVGTVYVLDQHDDHILCADAGADMVLVSVFNPPLKGTERHSLAAHSGSAY
ncbi:ectoine synthase [uncultured Lentibacter sp.]|uniref:ectoine synthase n=1 Tax=uncultured Lentibacter sp. TaxID=1659309 RepID=UPI002607D0FA|nr:ectoine synthase [uncultured Lentibacter sp.]MCW1955190.1 ectoine synthase [Roseobacter sp.]